MYNFVNKYLNYKAGISLSETQTIDEEKEYNNFLQKVKTCFSGIEITTLDKLVKKISLSPSVRTGDKNRLDSNITYYEVGMKDSDEEGVVTIEYSKNKKLGAANNYLIKKYALKENDLLLPYRVSRNYKVLRVGSNYPAPLVTNASVIRIEMHDDTPKDIAMLIQTYLLSWFVQQYVIPKDVHQAQRMHPRHLISTKRLASLPIPKFTADMLQDGKYEALFKNKKLLESKGIKLANKSRELLHCVDRKSEELLKLYLYDKERINPILEKEEMIVQKMQQLLDELTNLTENVDCNRVHRGPKC